MTLETIITELTAYLAPGAITNGSPAHVARYVLALANVVAEMRQAVEGNARLAGHEAAKRTPTFESNVGPWLDRLSIMSMQLQAAQESRDAALADVQRLTARHDVLHVNYETLQADRDRLAREYEACLERNVRLTTIRDSLQRQSDALATDIQRLTSQREAYREQRDALEGDVRRLTKERDAVGADFDRTADAFAKMTADRDTWKAEAEKLRMSAEAVERDVVERIATFIEQNPALQQLPRWIRKGTWKETAQ